MIASIGACSSLALLIVPFVKDQNILVRKTNKSYNHRLSTYFIPSIQKQISILTIDYDGQQYNGQTPVDHNSKNPDYLSQNQLVQAFLQ